MGSGPTLTDLERRVEALEELAGLARYIEPEPAPPQPGAQVPVASLQRIVDYYFNFDYLTHTPASVDAIEDDYRVVRTWLAGVKK